MHCTCPNLLRHNVSLEFFCFSVVSNSLAFRWMKKCAASCNMHAQATMFENGRRITNFWAVATGVPGLLLHFLCSLKLSYHLDQTSTFFAKNEDLIYQAAFWILTYNLNGTGPWSNRLFLGKVYYLDIAADSQGFKVLMSSETLFLNN